MKKIFQFIVSMPVTGFLLLFLVFSMALATFIEANMGTDAAKNLIYNAHWFEIIMLILGVSLVANFFRKRLYQKGKLAIGIYHLSFVIILTGAAITRYVSFEGVIHIRENESSSSIVTSDSYLTIQTPEQEIRRKVLFSNLNKGKFDENIKINGHSVRIKSIGFVKNAQRTVVEHPGGTPLIDLVISTGDGMENFTIGRGEKINLVVGTVGFSDDADIRFIQEGDSLIIVSAIELEKRSMSGNVSEAIPSGSKVKVQEKDLYAFHDHLLLIRKFYPRALIRVSRNNTVNTSEDAVILEISEEEKTNILNVFGTKGVVGNPVTCSIAGSDIVFSYGAEIIELPFELYLRDFQVEHYIGSESPSSFASELTLKDNEQQFEQNFRVFMNNTLRYHGYRFYQSSYDQDEMGTVLSVNKDFLGTLVTYIGYVLMTLGMIFALLSRKSYFQQLIRRLKELNKQKLAGLVILFLLLGQNIGANDAVNNSIPKLEPQLVKEFSKLWVHGKDGRIEPMSTLSGEILRKVSRKSSLFGMSPDEVMLSMHIYPMLWQSVQMIKVDKLVAVQLGISGTYASVQDFFDDKGQYIIQDEVQAAYNKTPALRSQSEKNYLYADERLNICFMVYRGNYFTFFPSQNYDDAWYAAGESPEGYAASDSLAVNKSFELLKEAVNPQSEHQPLEIISSVVSLQAKYGGDILPDQTKKSVEILYNKIQPFKRIFPYYLALGFILLVILFVNIFRQKLINIYTKRVFTILIMLGFVFHTLGLILRWYIAGHAPWSNGYESMVYVAWAAMLSGIVFGRKYQMVLGTAAFLSGLTLFVAHLSWMNPEISNLVPVLKSHWLLSHVAVITGSYGFIGLSAFLGLLVMILYTIMKDINRNNVDHFIAQLTTISEMSATLGLYMLIVGTFLGGVWANESWGRYWGWDPKETWALITVLVYSFIVHMRFIPSLRGRFIFNLAALVGFSSVLMTYFGVNYYLSGRHSYGKGSIEGIHWSVYVCLALVIILILSAYSKYKKYGMEDDTDEQAETF